MILMEFTNKFILVNLKDLIKIIIWNNNKNHINNNRILF